MVVWNRCSWIQLWAFMSDIPLRSLRRNKPQYFPINNDDDQGPISLESPAMPSSVAAVASTSRNNHKWPKGKGRERYVDDPRDSEGARLLADHYDHGEEGEEQEEEPQQIPVTPHKDVGKDKSRTIPFNPPEKLQSRHPPNIVRNQKYNAFTFLPIVFYEQFKFFFNLYFLLVALSQFIPALKIGASLVLLTVEILANIWFRFHSHLYCPPRVCPVCYHGKGSL